MRFVTAAAAVLLLGMIGGGVQMWMAGGELPFPGMKIFAYRNGPVEESAVDGGRDRPSTSGTPPEFENKVGAGSFLVSGLTQSGTLTPDVENEKAVMPLTPKVAFSVKVRDLSDKDREMKRLGAGVEPSARFFDDDQLAQEKRETR